MPLKRLIAVAVLVVAMVAGGIAALAVVRVEAALRPDVAARLDGVGRTIARQVGLALDYGIPLAAIPGTGEFLAVMIRDVPEVAHVRVTDAAGTTLHALGAPGEAREVSVPVFHDGAVAGVVVLGLAPGGDMAGSESLLARLVVMAGGGAVLGGGLIGLAGWWWGARPLGHLRVGLTALSGGARDVVFQETAAAGIGALARDAERLRAEAARRQGDFALEMEELALAQPDAARRAAVEALAPEILAPEILGKRGR